MAHTVNDALDVIDCAQDKYPRSLTGLRGEALGPDDDVISADEKSGLQILARLHPTVSPVPGQAARYEFEYVRHGTLAYLAALDVFSGHVFGPIEDTTGIAPYRAL